ncbi:hypothetical protein ATKI12_7127 [Kitasatospora sp. Ki12]|uniref:hypothetical protein n=1 Tax=Kitasatospora xanthocidica TaxID=83382 RepID=UPI001671CCFD|nr:hypothetical protein [Kitasatospora xanthocidica]GHF56882.1 hypothetical protein GCM10018790_38630 [Kitasatospora xanthocidica]
MSVNRTSAGRRAAALGALALAGSLLAAVPAQAAPSAAPTAGSAPTGDGAKAVCKRLPKTEQRVTKALARLNGDATVGGSVARLQQRAANAKTAGHTEIEKLLNDRLTARKNLVTTLQTRQEDLKSVATWCGAHDQGAGK